jgi:hypothetical protein
VAPAGQTNRPLQINDTVKLKGQETVGTILSLDETKNKAEVAFGAVKDSRFYQAFGTSCPQTTEGSLLYPVR